jgi:hypothetical protein
MPYEEDGPKIPTDRQETDEALTGRPQDHSQPGLHQWLDNLPPDESPGVFGRRRPSKRRST